MQQNVDMETALLAAFATVTLQDCQSWISESRLYSELVSGTHKYITYRYYD